MIWPRFLFSRDRMKIVQRLLFFQKQRDGRVKLGVFELALLIDKAWTNGLDSMEIDTSLTYYEAKRDLEKKGHGDGQSNSFY